MTTVITAKELRNNLDKVVQRVRAGEKLRVTYRSKPAFEIQPYQINEPAPGSNEAIERFLAAADIMREQARKGVFDPNKSTKEFYREMLDNDPKYKPPYHR